MARWNQSRRLQQQQNQFAEENYQEAIDPSMTGQEFSNELLNVDQANLNATQSRKGGEKKRSRKA